MAEAEKKTGHTPGPWMRDGATVYALEMERGEVRNRFCAQVQRGPETPGEELEANTRLMTAAPDMAEALVDARFCIEAIAHQRGVPADSMYAHRTVTEALRKAGVLP